MDHRNTENWKIWVDTGGTFTDCVAVDGSARVHRAKVLSNGALRGSVARRLTPRRLVVDVTWGCPRDFVKGFEFAPLESPGFAARVTAYEDDSSIIEVDAELPVSVDVGTAFEVRSDEEAPILAARMVTNTGAGEPLPPLSMRLATTRGTNALLERRGTPTALFITRGFGDLLLIRDQQRPELFALDIRKPAPLYEAVVEVPERLAADGTVLEALRLDKVAADIERLADSGIRSAAVALLHSYRNPAHEIELADALTRAGFQRVSCSSRLAPFIRIVPRAQTTVVDAYLSPIIGDYVGRVRDRVAGGRLHVMTSAGGMADPESYRAMDSLLSGPAGGVVGAARAGRLSGHDRIIAFDMGGTSTDVARFEGDFDYVFEHRVGDAHLVAPALAIESVAAGGGSICSFDGVELHVGPQSAGATPGPACYGAGGPLTLTDVNLLLGRLDPRRFDIPIDRGAADNALEAVRDAVAQSTGARPAREELLQGYCDIANERMADAIRRISIRKGYDPADYALVAFGGAGGQHACAVAEQLDVGRVVIPEDVSLLSALGLGHAAIERFAERQILEPLDEVRADLPHWMEEMSEQAAAALVGEGISREHIEIRRRIVSLRFAGQDSVLQVDHQDAVPLEHAFENQYRSVFGHWQEGRAVEVESVRVVASSIPADDSSAVNRRGSDSRPGTPEPSGAARTWFEGRWQSAPTYERAGLSPGAYIDGPALVYERYSVTVVDPGWRAAVDRAGALSLQKTRRTTRPDDARPELVRLELFTNRFRAVAREMGEMLRRTAISTNVKERLDFSCAVLDAEGELVVNAPHIPVHLGAMGLCVRTLRDSIEMGPGDVVVTNHPRFGGSHLPDVTVVTPVYLPGDRLLGYVANRAHHAEIGGTRPGSMPPSASCLAEEGVVIPPSYLFRDGEPEWDDIRRALSEAPYPTRSLDENLADLRAAVAANRRGAAALARLAAEHGADTVCHFMDALKARAERKLCDALGAIDDGVYDAQERLDDGAALRARIEIAGDRAVVDFAGSAGVHPQSLNATPAVVTGAVIYVLRLLIDEPLPLNEGLMHAVTLRIPRGILNPEFPADPARAPAVVGGNVETSQRLVDTLLKALSLAACSQGTMNNVIFGDNRQSYYETICGGAGAGPDFDGADAVHTHMTNTRITDPEIIEHRYPVRVDRFAVRRGSGGRGRRRGGDGVVRTITFLEPTSVSVLGQHRVEGPYGLAGGDPGLPARLRIVRADGTEMPLSSIDGCEAGAGDRLEIETPGGGGYGTADPAGS